MTCDCEKRSDEAISSLGDSYKIEIAVLYPKATSFGRVRNNMQCH